MEIWRKNMEANYGENVCFMETKSLITMKESEIRRTYSFYGNAKKHSNSKKFENRTLGLNSNSTRLKI